MKNYTLTNGVEVPAIGFGTWQTPDGDVAKASVLKALDVGYRHIDTATIYGNEQSVGDAIVESGIDRNNLFITTKLWNDMRHYDEVMTAIDASLEKLQIDVIDLYLVHWPNPVAYRDDWKGINSETWRAIEDAYDQGKLRAIGVSNFHQHHLEALYETARIKPMVNQIYLNPSDMQAELVAYNTDHGMLTEAYSPLGTGNLFEVPELIAIAKQYNRTVAQVTLRWSLQHGFLPLPKSVTPSRIEENFQIHDFELSSEDMARIDALHGVAGTAPDPDTKNY